MQVQVKASSSRYSQVNYHQRCAGGTENMQGQIQTCSNLQGQVEEAPWDNPSMKSPVWAGLGMDWLQGTHLQTETLCCRAPSAPLPLYPSLSAEQRSEERRAA